jgi:hypothetical protein
MEHPRLDDQRGPFFLLRRVPGQGRADRDPRRRASNGRAEGPSLVPVHGWPGPPRAADRSARDLDSWRRGETRVSHMIQVLIFIDFLFYFPYTGR